MHAELPDEKQNDEETPEENGDLIRGNANQRYHYGPVSQMNKKLHHWVKRWWKARLQLRKFVRAELEAAANQMKRPLRSTSSTHAVRRRRLGLTIDQNV